MAFQCNNGNDVCQGKLGRYKIRYTVPSPGRLEYQYPGESVQVISGDGLTYTTQQNTPEWFGGQQINVGYKMQFQYNNGGSATGWSPIYTTWGAEAGKFVDVRLLIGGVEYPLSSHWSRNGFGSSPPIFSGTSARSYSVRVYRHTGQVVTFGEGGVSYGMRIVGFVLAKTGLPDGTNPPPGDCTFKVFQNGTEIFSRTDPACPTVNIFNCFMGDDKGEFAISNSNPAKTLDIVQSLSGNVRSSEVKLGGVTVKKLDSPAGCQLYPEVCYDCEEEEKCPPGTCECTRGNLVCCYDPTTGEVVKSFTKG